MRLRVLDEERREEVREPYVVRLWGWTLERYLEEAPENAFCEFARGEVIMYSPVSAEHQDLVGFLLWLLKGYCEAKGWGRVLTGPAAIRILPDVIREPDIFVFPPQEAPKVKGTPIEAKPCLVVEVTSPWTRAIDLGEKARDYEQAQIPEYWVVDREEGRVLAHTLTEKGYKVKALKGGRLESRAVPGFWIDVGWLFQDPLPPASECLREMLRGEQP